MTSIELILQKYLYLSRYYGSDESFRDRSMLKPHSILMRVAHTWFQTVQNVRFGEPHATD